MRLLNDEWKDKEIPELSLVQFDKLSLQRIQTVLQELVLELKKVNI